MPMPMIEELRRKRAEVNQKIQALAAVEQESGELTAEQLEEFDALKAEFDQLTQKMARAEEVERIQAAAAQPVTPSAGSRAPAVHVKPELKQYPGASAARLVMSIAAGGGNLQDAAETVDDEGRKRFTVDILGDDQETLAGLRHAAENRDEVLGRTDLLLMDQDVAVLEHRFHRRRVGDEVGAEVPLVELHAFDEFDVGVEARALFHGDDAVLANLVHRLGDDVADRAVLIGCTGADLGDLARGLHGLGHALEFIVDRFDGHVDSTANLGGIRTGRDVLQALGEDRFRVDGRSRRSIPGVL